MREKPILFNTEMVRMILDGRKTQTRRVMKGLPLQEPHATVDEGDLWIEDEDGKFWRAECFSKIQPGDMLWVRETFAVWSRTYGSTPRIVYRADVDPRDKTDYEWFPSIHMPRDIARIFLRVKRVHAERVQEISPEDCVAEGCDADMLSHVGPEFIRGVFNGIWDSTIKKKDLPLYGWDANPWVWVIEFERIENGGTENG